MKTRLLLLISLGAVLVAMPTAALGGSSRAVANSITFQDSIGEDANAPDISSVVVTNDDAGNIVFQVNISNRPALSADMLMLVFLDTDKNAATGSTQNFGAEYVIQLELGSVTLFQWNGTDFTAAAAQTSLTYTYASTGAQIRISASDLGKTKAFNFVSFAASGFTTDAAGNADPANLHTDLAPDPGHGSFAYPVLTKLVLSVSAFTTAPKPAAAGKRFSATMSANENDTAGPVRAGAVTCAATIAFKRIPALTHVLTNGVASCVWPLPRTAKGKTLRGTITLTVKGVKVTRSFSAKIS